MRKKTGQWKDSVAVRVLAGVLILTMLAVGFLLITPTLAANEIRNDGVTLLLRDPDRAAAGYFTGSNAEFYIIINLTGLKEEDDLYKPRLSLAFSAADSNGDPLTDLTPTPILSSITHHVNDPLADGYWQFETIKAGETFVWPALVSMPNLITPDGCVITVTATLTAYDDAGRPIVKDSKVVETESAVEIRWSCEQMSLNKTVKREDYLEKLDNRVNPQDPDPEKLYETYEVWGGLNENGRIPMEGADKIYPVKFTIDLAPPMSNAYRAYDPEQTYVYDVFPDQAVFYPDDNPGWQAVTFEGKPAARILVSDERSRSILLRFPGALSFDQASYDADPDENKDQKYYHFNRAVCEVRLRGQLAGERPYVLESGCIVRMRATLVNQGDLNVMFNKMIGVHESALRNVDYPDSPGGNTYRKWIQRPAAPYMLASDYWWIDVFDNATGLNVFDATIQDDQLDARMKFTKCIVVADRVNLRNGLRLQYRLAGESEWREATPITAADLINTSLESVPMSEEEKEFFFNPSMPSVPGVRASAVIPLPGGLDIDGVRLINGDPVQDGGVMILALCSKLRDPDIKIKFDSLEEPPIFVNTATFTANIGTTSSSAEHRIKPYNPVMYAKHADETNISYDNMLDVPRYTPQNPILIHTQLSTKEMHRLDSLDGAGVGVMVLLPFGVIFNDDSVDDRLDTLRQDQPQIIDNYNGTGKMALIWAMRPGNYQANSTLIDFSFEVLATEYCANGDQEIEIYYTWTYERFIAGVDGNIYLNFEPSGDPGERSLRYAPRVNLLMPVGMNGFEFVKGDLNADFLSPTQATDMRWRDAPGRGAAGSVADFKLNVVNSEATAKSFTLFDVLPYKGDLAIEPQTSVQDLSDRGSDMDVKLVKPAFGNAVSISLVSDRADVSVIDADCFVIYYTTQFPDTWTNIADFEAAYGASWLTADQVGGDWDKIRAFKIVMIDGVELRTGEEIVVDFSVLLPEDAQSGNVAYNSFARTYGDGGFSYPYLEVRRVGIVVAREYDVALTKEVDRPWYYVGDTVAYTITVENNTIHPVTNARVEDEIPEEVAFDPSDPQCFGWLDGTTVTYDAAAFTYDEETRILSVTVGDMAGEEIRRFIVKCTAQTPKEVIPNGAEVAIDEEEIDYENNRDTAEIQIVAGALHLRQLILYPEGVIAPATREALPEAYVQVVSMAGRSFDEWVRFKSGFYSEYEDLRFDPDGDVIPVPMDTLYQINVNVPGGYELCVVEGHGPIEYSIPDKYAAPIRDNHVYLYYSAAVDATEAWVTILLKKLPDAPYRERIRNVFPPLHFNR